MPPRNFNWRIRGNSLQWGFGSAEELGRNYDLLIATSMTDLSSLRGFIPSLAKIPSIVYFHENQFVYPPGTQQRTGNVEPQLVPIYSALCADTIVFNSAYNRDTFLEGARNLFNKLPDDLPPGLMPRLEKSEVIPVSLPNIKLVKHSAKNQGPLEVIWNHRWEYDKGPKLLLKLVQIINEKKYPVRLHVVGEQFREQPEEFEKIHTLLMQHAHALKFEFGEFGFIANQEHYYALLQQGDVVLSTALHDFQGLAIQEACIAGCTPLTPDNLVYPEYLDTQFLYPINSDIESTARLIASKLSEWQEIKREGKQLPKARLEMYSNETLIKKYTTVFSRLGADD